MSSLKKWVAGWRLVGLLALVAIVVWLALRGLPDGRLHVDFLDVGQGDAVPVQAPDGRQILVDGGPSPTALLNELGEVLPFWDRSLDLVVLTHPDGDHITGLIPLLDRYRVGKVLDVPQSESAPEAVPWLEALAALEYAANPGAAWDAFAHRRSGCHRSPPGPVQLTGTASDDNNNAVVLRLDYGQTSFILTGDAESEAEADMIVAGLPLRADVLKVGHHGSTARRRPRSSWPWPGPAAIPVGVDNKFGHPHPAVLERLSGVEALRTDQNGRIEVVSDGQRLSVETQRTP